MMMANANITINAILVISCDRRIHNIMSPPVMIKATVNMTTNRIRKSVTIFFGSRRFFILIDPFEIAWKIKLDIRAQSTVARVLVFDVYARQLFSRGESFGLEISFDYVAESHYRTGIAICMSSAILRIQWYHPPLLYSADKAPSK